MIRLIICHIIIQILNINITRYKNLKKGFFKLVIKLFYFKIYMKDCHIYYKIILSADNI